MYKFDDFKNHYMNIFTFSKIQSLLLWDQETFMPKNGNNFRADQISKIGELIHINSIDKKFGEIINYLYENSKNLSEIENRSILLAKKNFDKKINIPVEFVVEFEQAKAIGQTIRVEARKENNFKKFLPYLEKNFELIKKYCNYINKNKYFYDILIDEFEEGTKTQDIVELFENLKIELISLIKNIKTPKPILDYKKLEFEKHRLVEFIKILTKQIGFDFNRGTMGEVYHPFCDSYGKDDIRINTHYRERISAITGIIHELGHGLYEQNIGNNLYGTNLFGGLSLGIHESQSRLLENIIGKSEGFVKFLTKQLNLSKIFNQNIEEKNLYQTLNFVSPTFIRTESDEVTYNLHIIIRFEIEKGVLDGNYKLKDLPDIWNQKYKDYLGIVPNNDFEGCMQDVHWSGGAIGYFPTYTIGNLLSGQLYHKFLNENPSFYDNIQNGDFSQYFNFFKKNVWQYGGLYSLNEILNKLGFEKLDSKYFINYLKNKYL